MIKIVGDINFSDGYFDAGFGVGSSIVQGADPFVGLKRKDSDYWIGNFECVCSNVSDKKATFANQFRISPICLSKIKHLDLYGVANNHVMQHGNDAYKEMLAYLEENHISHIGSKRQKKSVFTHQGKQIGILAFSQRPDNFTNDPLYWSLPEYSEIKNEIESLADCNYRIAYVHWGNEFIDFPYKDQVQLAHYMIECGIDLLIGMHPHRLQGYEIYKGKYIFYSLGNCVFNMKWEPTRYSIVVNVDFNSDQLVSYDYLYIGDNFFPRYIDNIPDEYDIENLATLVNHSIENEKYYAEVFCNLKQYRKVNRVDFIKNVHNFKFKDFLNIISEFLRRK